MTRKYIKLFIITFVLAFFCLSLVMSENGLVANSNLRREIASKEKEVQELRIEIESMKNRKESMQTVSSTEDIAFKLGYISEGDEVYYFTDEEMQNASLIEENAETGKPVETFSYLKITLISLVIAILFPFLYIAVIRVGRRYVERKR